jgi:hypothetical protein
MINEPWHTIRTQRTSHRGVHITARHNMRLYNMDIASILKIPTMGRSTKIAAFKTTATATNPTSTPTDKSDTRQIWADERIIAMVIMEATASLTPKCAHSSNRMAGPSTRGISSIPGTRVRLCGPTVNNQIYRSSSKLGQGIASHPWMVVKGIRRLQTISIVVLTPAPGFIKITVNGSGIRGTTTTRPSDSTWTSRLPT